MNNDLQMTEYGDLYLSNHDVVQTDSIRQQILIKLRWFLGETQYGPDFGVDYWQRVFVKNPNRTLVLGLISEQVRSVEGVKSVTDTKIIINNETRNAKISFVVHTDYDEWLQEFDLQQEAQAQIYTIGNKLIFENLSGQVRIKDDVLYIDDTVSTEVKDDLLTLLGVK